MAVPKKFKFKQIKKKLLKLKKNYYMKIQLFRETDYIVEYFDKYFLDQYAPYIPSKPKTKR